MSRIELPGVDAPKPAEVEQVFEGATAVFGLVPNVTRMMSKSPTVLSAVVSFQMAMRTVLDPETRNAVALAVSKANDCDYCSNAHAYNATRFTQTQPDEIERNRDGDSVDAKRGAAAAFAAAVILSSGNVTDEQLAEVRGAGYSDAEILEIVAFSVSVLATNYINNVAGTAVDLTAKMAAETETVGATD